MRNCPRVAGLVSMLDPLPRAPILPGTALAAATSPTSPVDLATPVNAGAAKPAPGATVLACDARFEVWRRADPHGLASGSFEDAPTVTH